MAGAGGGGRGGGPGSGGQVGRAGLGLKCGPGGAGAQFEGPAGGTGVRFLTDRSCGPTITDRPPGPARARQAPASWGHGRWTLLHRLGRRREAGGGAGGRRRRAACAQSDRSPTPSADCARTPEPAPSDAGWLDATPGRPGAARRGRRGWWTPLQSCRAAAARSAGAPAQRPHRAAHRRCRDARSPARSPPVPGSPPASRQ